MQIAEIVLTGPLEQSADVVILSDTAPPTVTMSDVDVEVVVIMAGPPGPPGDVDPTLVGELVEDYLEQYEADHPPAPIAFEQNFAVAALVWDCTHNLGFTPAVTVMTAAREVVRAHVAVNTTSRTVVEFYFPVAGILALS